MKFIFKIKVLMVKCTTVLFIFASVFSSKPTFADEVMAAVASNFLEPFTKIATEFERQGGAKVKISSGSTGQLYAQISQGAPFDIFFAADAVRPQRLMKDGMTAGQSKTYAFGRLALLCATDKIPCTLDSLEQGKFIKLAIANPDIAPYGFASRQIIQMMGKKDYYLDKFIYGQNISQTMQFVMSGAVDAGFVAVSDLMKMNGKLPGQYVFIDPRFHDPIEQRLIIIKGKTNTADARYLAEFVLGPKGREIIKSFGYDPPNIQKENGS